MKTRKMDLLFTLLIFISCNKDNIDVSKNVINNMIVNKNWYLDYSIIGTHTESFIGQSSYMITFLKDGTTKDSDGIIGTYDIVNTNGQYQLLVNGKTTNGNVLKYTHLLESVGDINMVQSYSTPGQSLKTVLYFTSRK